MKQSGFGITSLVCGIIGMLLACFFIGIIPSIIGLVFAIVAFAQKDRGHGTAVGGLICSILGMVIFAACLGMSGTDDAIDYSTEYIEETADVSEMEQQEQEKQTKIEKPHTIWKDKKCIIKVVSCDNETAELKIVNKSKKDYDFDVHAMAINGVMTGCNIYTADTSVPAGKKAMMEIDFEENWVGNLNVEYVDLLIWAYDNAESMKDFDTGIIRIKTNKYEKDTKFKNKKDSFDEKGIYISKNDMTDSEISYSMINHNDYFVSTTLENCSINGWAFEPGYSFSEASDSYVASLDGNEVIIFPNCLATVNVDISDFMEENNEEKIKDFEFSLQVLPKEDYFQETHTKKIVFKN